MDCVSCCPGFGPGLTSNACIFDANSVSALPTALDANGQERLKELISLTPRNWYSDAAKAPGGVYYNFIATIADELGALEDDIDYVRQQTRVSTASECFLDLVASDFFGGGLQRLPGEDDNTYRAQILANLLLIKATRQAVINALAKFGAPIMIMCEPWYPLDCGGYARMMPPGPDSLNEVVANSGTYPAFGGPGGSYPATGSSLITTLEINQNLIIPAGLSTTEPDTTIVGPTATVTVIGTLAITGSLIGGVAVVEPPFAGYGTWGNISRPYQGFITVLRPGGVIYGPNILGYGTAGYTPLSVGYIDGTINPFSVIDQAIYCTLDAIKAFGTVIWVAISSMDIGQRAQGAAPALVLNS